MIINWLIQMLSFFLQVDWYKIRCGTGTFLPVFILLEAHLEPRFSFGSDPPKCQSIQASIWRSTKSFTTAIISYCTSKGILLCTGAWNQVILFAPVSTLGNQNQGWHNKSIHFKTMYTNVFYWNSHEQSYNYKTRERWKEWTAILIYNTS